MGEDVILNIEGLILEVDVMASHRDEIIVIRKLELNFSRYRTVANQGHHTVITGTPYSSLQRMAEIISMSGGRLSDIYNAAAGRTGQNYRS